MAMTLSRKSKDKKDKDAHPTATVPTKEEMAAWAAAAERIAARATAAADQAAVERAQVAAQLAAVEREVATQQAQQTTLTRERDDLVQRIKDAATLAELGLATTAALTEASHHLQALQRDLDALEAALQATQGVQAQLSEKVADLTAHEEQKRHEAAEAPITAQLAERARLIREIRRARAAYAMTLRDAGAWNLANALTGLSRQEIAKLRVQPIQFLPGEQDEDVRTSIILAPWAIRNLLAPPPGHDLSWVDEAVARAAEEEA